MVKWYKPENGDLPPSGKKVLCLTKGRAGAGYIISHQEGKRWQCGANRTVVAWMYLPDPPIEPPVRRKRGNLDAGKAQALRNAGWKLAAIAEELGVSAARISQVTAPAPPKRKFALEGNYTDWPEYNRPMEYL